MEVVPTVFTQIRTLVQPLSAEQRLQVIQDIASLAQVEEADQETPLPSEQLAIEEASWYALPVETRARYANQHVAIKNEQIVDHDEDQRALYLRVRQRFGSTPVAILWAGWEEPPIFEIRSPRLER